MAGGDDIDAAIAAALELDGELAPPEVIEGEVGGAPDEGVTEDEDFATRGVICGQRLASPVPKFAFVGGGFAAMIFFDKLVVAGPELAGGPAGELEIAEDEAVDGEEEQED